MYVCIIYFSRIYRSFCNKICKSKYKSVCANITVILTERSSLDSVERLKVLHGTKVKSLLSLSLGNIKNKDLFSQLFVSFSSNQSIFPIN